MLHVADVMLGYYDLLLVVFEFGVGFGAVVLFDGWRTLALIRCGCVVLYCCLLFGVFLFVVAYLCR